MDKQQIIEGNEAIAKFMGAKISYTKSDMFPNGWLKFNDDPNTFHGLDRLMYHNSWDWIMPVVKKINEQPKQTLASFCLKKAVGEVKLERAWELCVEFITQQQHGT